MEEQIKELKEKVDQLQATMERMMSMMLMQSLNSSIRPAGNYTTASHIYTGMPAAPIPAAEKSCVGFCGTGPVFDQVSY